MKSLALRFFHVLSFWLVPLAAAATGHELQGMNSLLRAVPIVAIVLVIIGFATRVFVWPSFSTLTGKIAVIILAWVVLFVLGLVLTSHH